jgi:hypothetical protein
LPRNGKTACVRRSRACLADPPALSPSTMKISEPSEADELQSASLPGRRSLRTALLRAMSFSCRRRMRSSARSTTKSSSLLACSGLPASQWSKGSFIACSTMRWASAGGQAVFRLSLEFGLPHENREHAAGAGHDIVAGNRGSALFLADTSGVVFQSAQECRPQTGFVCPPSGVGIVLQ